MIITGLPSKDEGNENDNHLRRNQVRREYCSQMNPIELEWKHLKEEEIAGQMFEDELDGSLCRDG